MKSLVFIFILLGSVSYGQLMSGDLLAEGRRMISPIGFLIEGRANGFISYELAVDRDGNVTSARLLTDESDIKSTPSQIEVYKHVMKMKFESGTHFPKFHHVVVKVTLVKPLEKKEEE
jgi:hypothetical protein